MFDVVLVVVSKVAEAAPDRSNQGIAQGTERVPLNAVAE
jgi:hypothetical protein